MQLSKVLPDPSGVVTKIIFEDESAIAETVAYKYEDRGVICFSVQSGCPVGCSFCGTGNNFIRNLTVEEMMDQIKKAASVIGPVKKLQVMSMSMGDPMLNWWNVRQIATFMLENLASYFFISTVGIRNDQVMQDILNFGKIYPKFGLQFSLHYTDEQKRDEMFRNKSLKRYTIPEMLSFGRLFSSFSGNKAYYNYIVRPMSEDEFEKELSWICASLFGMHLTCSVLCDPDPTKRDKSDLSMVNHFANEVFSCSNGEVDVSIFNPAGQDTIGGGCGQLWYVQEKLKNIN